MKKTVIVIGGGMGGLFTGAFLSKEGFKVTILEKNATIVGVAKYAVGYGAGFVEIWIGSYGTVRMECCFLAFGIFQLAVCSKWGKFRVRQRAVDVYHKKVSFEYGLSYDFTKLCIRTHSCYCLFS